MKKIAFSLLTVLLCLLALEGLSRLWEGAQPRRQMPLPLPGRANREELATMQAQARQEGSLPPIPLSADEERGWGLPAGTVGVEGNIPVRYNRLGLRGPEVSPRAADEERLFTLGDSSIYGQAVPEDAVFSSVAAKALSQTWGRPVSAVIGGVPGYSSTQAEALLRKLGKEVQPTWVIIGTLWSDVYPENARTLQQQADFLRKFAIYRVGVSLLTPWLAPQKVGYLNGRGDVGGGDGVPARTSLEEYRKNLETMVQETLSLGARPAVLILPAPLDFDPVPPPATVLEYRDVLRELASRYHAPLVDGPRDFPAAGGTVAHFGDQVHPNANGHLLLGQLLAKALASP